MSIEVACHGVTGGELSQHRLLFRASGHCVWAAWVEAAAGRRVEGTRHLAAEDDLPPRLVGVRGQRRREQRLGVGVEWGGAELEAVGHLDELAEIHDRRLVAQMRDRGEVMGNKQIA